MFKKKMMVVLTDTDLQTLTSARALPISTRLSTEI